MSVKDLVFATWMALAPESQQHPSQCAKNCVASDNGLAIIRQFEGYSPFVYNDAAGLPTVGFGHLIRPGEKFSQPLLPKEAEELLKKDVVSTERGVNRRAHVKLWQKQFDALVSFTFNLGEGALSKSTLLKKVNAGQHGDVPPEFGKWVFAGGKKLRGLILRRDAEAMLYEEAP